MNSWQALLLLTMAKGEYIHKRPATNLDWWTLTSMAQELNGWTVIVG
ncbi:MAG: hypothetical protein V3U27_21385 [Candidatus Tectomicrobia bacterium]